MSKMTLDFLSRAAYGVRMNVERHESDHGRLRLARRERRKDYLRWLVQATVAWGFIVSFYLGIYWVITKLF